MSTLFTVLFGALFTLAISPGVRQKADARLFQGAGRLLWVMQFVNIALCGIILAAWVVKGAQG